MQVKLVWANRNSLTVQTKIYRNETYTDSSALGAPIATLPGTTLEWIDPTAVIGKTYWYTLGTVYESTEVFTKPVTVSVRYDNGPGPNTLEYGNSELGYFGRLEAVNFFTTQEVAEPFALTPASTNLLPTWDKWIRRGKIIYVPRGRLSSGSWQTLYAKGLIFGTDGPGCTWATPQVNQTASVSKGFYSYRVRNMTLADDRTPRDSTWPSVVSVNRKYSECADLFYPNVISGYFSPSQRFPRAPYAGSPATMLSGLFHGQERFSDGDILVQTNNPNNNTWDTIDFVTPSAGPEWHPVLELKQSNLILKEIK